MFFLKKSQYPIQEPLYVINLDNVNLLMSSTKKRIT